MPDLFKRQEQDKDINILAVQHSTLKTDLLADVSLFWN
jgi:hypothetical protein